MILFLFISTLILVLTHVLIGKHRNKNRDRDRKRIEAISKILSGNGGYVYVIMDMFKGEAHSCGAASSIIADGILSSRPYAKNNAHPEQDIAKVLGGHS